MNGNRFSKDFQKLLAARIAHSRANGDFLKQPGNKRTQADGLMIAQSTQDAKCNALPLKMWNYAFTDE